jgi:hypothetical protein
LQDLPNEVVGFYSVGFSDGKATEYYNQKRFNESSIFRNGHLTRVDFNVNSLEFAFVATNKEGGFNWKLQNFQIYVQKCTMSQLTMLARIGVYFYPYFVASALVILYFTFTYLWSKYCHFFEPVIIPPPLYIPSAEDLAWEEGRTLDDDPEGVDKAPAPVKTAVNSFFQPNDDVY